ncbi:MAG: ribose 5-phosphate isomerase A [Desulfurococcales archaeon]|nr:ribose 5-phosphate isomerase A [Desulfurococcales archaeon]
MGENGKREAALRFVEAFGDTLNESSIIGVGTGSTVSLVIEELAVRGILEGKTIVATSLDSMYKLRSNGILPAHPSAVASVDVYFDGADEVDMHGNMIKGRGAALYGEKMIAFRSKLNVFIIDESKLVESLGTKKPLPVEVHPWMIQTFLLWAEHKGLKPEPRRGGGRDGPVISDYGGVIVDLFFENGIEDPRGLEEELTRVPGVVETGLFLGYTDYVVVGWDKGGGEIRSYKRTRGIHYR